MLLDRFRLAPMPAQESGIATAHAPVFRVSRQIGAAKAVRGLDVVKVNSFVSLNEHPFTLRQSRRKRQRGFILLSSEVRLVVDITGVCASQCRVCHGEIGIDFDRGFIERHRIIVFCMLPQRRGFSVFLQCGQRSGRDLWQRLVGLMDFIERFTQIGAHPAGDGIEGVKDMIFAVRAFLVGADRGSSSRIDQLRRQFEFLSCARDGIRDQRADIFSSTNLSSQWNCRSLGAGPSHPLQH